ncbi:ribonuclease E inhibitor RraB, partial [Pseudomonas syringae]|nr:ribonuclease E inhibitor RraB [Pseudomonas syringae]
EELEVDDGSTVMCCDVISEIELKAELIDIQVEQLMNLAEANGVNYDGWGTYFEGDDDEEGEEGEDEDFIDEDDDGKRH